MVTKEVENISLMDDGLFKFIFGTNKNIRFLEDFLESYFNYPQGYLKNKIKVKYEVALPKDNYKQKNIMGDVVVESTTFVINIEVYQYLNRISLDKSDVYIMRLYLSQYSIGSEYGKGKPVIQINIFKKISDEFKGKIEDKSSITGNFKIIYIKLDKIEEMKYTNVRYKMWL